MKRFVLALFLTGCCCFAGCEVDGDLDEINASGTRRPMLKLPEIFTPNNDGINDTWEWSDLQYCTNAKLKVFNRMNEKVFSAEPYRGAWDGTSEGRAVPEGVYTYTLSCDGVEDIYGSVRIVR